jgi:hypothetical protein
MGCLNAKKFLRRTGQITKYGQEKQAKVRYRHMSFNLKETVLVCPRNDEESLQILKIAEKVGIPTLVSKQPHGARLSEEESLIERIREVNPDVRTVAIVEIPGPEREHELTAEGFAVIIIDHHRYDDLDRMKQLSSLEQFLDIFEIDDVKLEALGFEPLLVKGVGMIDRGFIWELKKEGLTAEEQKKCRDYYLSLLEELGGLRKDAVVEAKRAWDAREERDGVSIIRSKSDEFRIREAFSFLMADLFENPPSCLIIEGNGRLSLQDTDAAKRLHDTFGGYTFGKDRCWGFWPTDEKPAPSIEEILTVVREK